LNPRKIVMLAEPGLRGPGAGISYRTARPAVTRHGARATTCRTSLATPRLNESAGEMEAARSGGRWPPRQAVIVDLTILTIRDADRVMRNPHCTPAVMPPHAEMIAHASALRSGEHPCP